MQPSLPINLLYQYNNPRRMPSKKLKFNKTTNISYLTLVNKFIENNLSNSINKNINKNIYQKKNNKNNIISNSFNQIINKNKKNNHSPTEKTSSFLDYAFKKKPYMNLKNYMCNTNTNFSRNNYPIYANNLNNKKNVLNNKLNRKRLCSFKQTKDKINYKLQVFLKYNLFDKKFRNSYKPRSLNNNNSKNNSKNQKNIYSLYNRNNKNTHNNIYSKCISINCINKSQKEKSLTNNTFKTLNPFPIKAQNNNNSNSFKHFFTTNNSINNFDRNKNQQTNSNEKIYPLFSETNNNLNKIENELKVIIAYNSKEKNENNFNKQENKINSDDYFIDDNENNIKDEILEIKEKSSLSGTLKLSESSSKTIQEGELKLEDVRDIIIYFDMDKQDEKNYLFKPNDENYFRKVKKDKYLKFFI